VVESRSGLVLHLRIELGAQQYDEGRQPKTTISRIVGIGSSAGGLEALQKLFGAMPPDSGLAFIVAAHLDPTQVSHLNELLSRCTQMPVVQIERSIQVEPNHVYVIAPDQDLTIRDGVVHTAKPSAPRGHRHPVDSFFRSLAQDQGERAIAIVRSGTGTNGSQGLRFIKAEGGIPARAGAGVGRLSGDAAKRDRDRDRRLVLPPEKIPQHKRGRPQKRCRCSVSMYGLLALSPGIGPR
jgi:two-component system CheB/CheR fusion protein